MKNQSNPNLIFLVFFVFIAMLVANLAVIPTNIMEARNLVTAREMVQDGHWIFTTLNGLPRYEKPPLPTWITAIVGSIFGFEDFFWLRMPVVLITGLITFFCYKILNQFHLSKEQIVHSVLIGLTSFYVFFAGRDNNWDMYTHAFMMGAIFFLLKQFQNDKYQMQAIVLAALFVAASIMSKGPVSLYALCLPFLLAYFMVYRYNWKRNAAITFGVIATGTIIGFAWMWYVKSNDPETFARVATKEVNNWHSYNTRPFYYYWSFFTQSGIWTIPALISLLYPYIKNKVSHPKVYRLVWLWTILSVVLLSLIPEKKSRYLLPVLFPLAMNTGFYIEYLRLELKNIQSKKEIYAIYFTFGLIGLIAIAVAFGGFIYFKTVFLQSLINPITKWVVGLLIVGLATSYFIFKGLKHKRFDFIFYPVVGVMCGIMIFGLPLYPLVQPNEAPASAQWMKKFEEKYQIKTYEANNTVPEIILDYGKPIQQLLNIDDKVELPKEKRFGLMIDKQDTVFIKENLNGYHVRPIGFVDLNTTSEQSKSYNPRLYRDYYLVEKD